MHAIAAGRPSYVSGIKSAGDSLNMKSHDLIIRNDRCHPLTVILHPFHCEEMVGILKGSFVLNPGRAALERGATAVQSLRTKSAIPPDERGA